MIICENCGKQCESNNIIVSVKNGCDISFYCRECNSLFGHCPMCSNYGPCGFFDDPDPMPQFVIARREHRTPMGIQIIQCQIPNSERAKKFCVEGKCKCLHTFEDGAKLCCRFSPYTTCTNYTEQQYKKFVENFPVETENEN